MPKQGPSRKILYTVFSRIWLKSKDMRVIVYESLSSKTYRIEKLLTQHFFQKLIIQTLFILEYITTMIQVNLSFGHVSLTGLQYFGDEYSIEKELSSV